MWLIPIFLSFILLTGYVQAADPFDRFENVLTILQQVNDDLRQPKRNYPQIKKKLVAARDEYMSGSEKIAQEISQTRKKISQITYFFKCAWYTALTLSMVGFGLYMLYKQHSDPILKINSCITPLRHVPMQHKLVVPCYLR